MSSKNWWVAITLVVLVAVGATVWFTSGNIGEYALEGFVNQVAQHSSTMRDEDTLKIVKAEKYDRQETRTLAEILPLLEAAMTKLDPRIPQLFNPGLTVAELEGLKLKGGQQLPPDIITLYSWHNGVHSYEAADLFMSYQFSPINETLTMMEVLGSFAPEHFFTILSNDFGTSVDLDLRDEKHFKSTVNIADPELGVLGVYPGINAFFGALLAAFEEGVFQVEKGTGPQGEDVLVAKYNSLNKAFEAFQFQNPEVTEDYTETEEDNPDYDYKVILPAK